MSEVWSKLRYPFNILQKAENEIYFYKKTYICVVGRGGIILSSIDVFMNFKRITKPSLPAVAAAFLLAACCNSSGVPPEETNPLATQVRGMWWSLNDRHDSGMGLFRQWWSHSPYELQHKRCGFYTRQLVQSGGYLHLGWTNEDKWRQSKRSQLLYACNLALHSLVVMGCRLQRMSRIKVC